VLNSHAPHLTNHETERPEGERLLPTGRNRLCRPRPYHLATPPNQASRLGSLAFSRFFRLRSNGCQFLELFEYYRTLSMRIPNRSGQRKQGVQVQSGRLLKSTASAGRSSLKTLRGQPGTRRDGKAASKGDQDDLNMVELRVVATGR